MIRFLLLGGRLGPAPWEVFVAFGASCLGAAGLLAALFPWESYPAVIGLIEEASLVTAGGCLIGIGARRRARTSSKP